MKLPQDTLIAQEKLTKYLLVFKKRNDKSKWLAKAGYFLENWQILENDLREQILSMNVAEAESSEYGQMYKIIGKLSGPSGSIEVCTIWMTETSTRITKFITMYPDRKE